VTAKAERHRPVVLFGKIVEKVFVPAPRSVADSVNEHQRRRVLLCAVAFVDHFEHGPPLRSIAAFRAFSQDYAADRLDSLDSLVVQAAEVAEIVAQAIAEVAADPS
jgi:hypothetical protein